MADVTVYNDIFAALETVFEFGPFWKDENTGYAFFVNGNNGAVAYVKTTDGGATWGSIVDIAGNSDSNGNIHKFHVWYDKDTPNDSGTKIHIVYNEWSNDSIRYQSLDTADDSQSTEVTLETGMSYNPSTAAWTAFSLSIAKARGGNLYVAFAGSGAQRFYRSTDGGVNWTTRTVPFESTVDVCLVLPANTSDSQDMICIFDDVSANAISLKMYDDSANTWTETAIASMTENAVANNFAASVRHSDGHILLAFWNAYDVATADLQTYDITPNSIATPTVTAKTNVLTNTGESAQCCVFIDQATDDVYVGYLKGGTWQTSVSVFYKKSTDDMGTWGSETAYSESAAADIGQLSCGLGVKSGQSGRFYIIWQHDVNNDLMGNKVNSIAITAGAAAQDTPELYGRPYGIRGQNHMHQLLAI